MLHHSCVTVCTGRDLPKSCTVYTNLSWRYKERVKVKILHWKNFKEKKRVRERKQGIDEESGNTTETGRLFFQRRAKQLPLARNIFELSPRGLQPTSNR